MEALFIGLGLIGVFCVALGVILVGVARRKAAAKALQDAAVASGPTNWVQVGVCPPPGVSVALEVIQASYPHLPHCGTIEWVDAPWEVPGFGRVAGLVMSFRPVHIKLMVAAKVEETALAHECLHVDDEYAGRAHRESPMDADFVSEFQAVNAAIKKALSA
jgi:hypothetical protein